MDPTIPMQQLVHYRLMMNEQRVQKQYTNRLGVLRGANLCNGEMYLRMGVHLVEEANTNRNSR